MTAVGANRLLLFHSEPAVPAITAIGSSARGTAAEYEAIARLLRDGRKVAVPVVDDDGVDLIVDYRLKVQVKMTGQLNPKGVPHLQLKRNSYVRRSDGERALRRDSLLPRHIDVLLVLVNSHGWYVVPRAEVRPSGLVFGPRMQQWREAWNVFDES